MRFVTWHEPGIRTVADDRFCGKLSPTPIVVTAKEELGSIPDAWPILAYIRAVAALAAGRINSATDVPK
jgi:hypothetical protein